MSLKLRLEREDKEDGSITYHLWTDAGEWIVGMNDDETKQGGRARGYANAIVRAVNAHDELVEALRNLVHGFESYENVDPLLAAARAAIAKAERRS